MPLSAASLRQPSTDSRSKALSSAEFAKGLPLMASSGLPEMATRKDPRWASSAFTSSAALVTLSSFSEMAGAPGTKA